MIEPAVVLNVSMRADAVRTRLSVYPEMMWCAVRDESAGIVSWSVYDAGELLGALEDIDGELSLGAALDTRSHAADVRASAEREHLRPGRRPTVVLDGTEVVGVVAGEGQAVIPGIYRDWIPGLPVDGIERVPVSRFIGWPVVSAPDRVMPNDAFVLTIALSREQRSAAPPIAVELLEEETEFDLDVDVAAVGLDAPTGWNRTLHIHPSEELPSTAILLRVRPDAPLGRVLIHVAFLHRGIVCGNATCGVVIGQGAAVVTPWIGSPCCVPHAGEEASDLVVLIRKSDGNGATGRYVWSMTSSRAVIDGRPFPIELGDDARTFARSLMLDVEQAGGALLEHVLRSIGATIAMNIPAAFWHALRAVAGAIAEENRLPSVLLYSAEMFVPWELALMDQPLGDGHPYLGAQTAFGRWIHSQTGAIPAFPPSSIPRNDLVVIAPDYTASKSGLPNLEGARAEANHMVEAYGAIEVDATEEDLGRLLNAELARENGSPAEITVVHIACHGSSNPTLPGSAGLFLVSGKRVSPNIFGASRLGRKFNPLLFLNACEVGTPQHLLSDHAGFAGIALRGGFRGFIAPLWSVSDAAAASVAHRFYERTLGDAAEAGSVLREIRRSSSPQEATPLAYIYYGHPRLLLKEA